MKISKYHLAILALIIANIIWGAAFPIFKWSLEDIGPFTFSFFRLFVGGLVLFPFVIHRLKIAREDVPYLITLSLVGVTLPITLLFFGLQLTASINAPIILSSGPVVLLLFSMLFLKEKIKQKVIFGTFISLTGVLMIIFQPLLQSGFSGSILGNGLLVITMLGAVIHTVMMKKILNKYHPLTITFWYFVIAGTPLIPFVLLEQPHGLLANIGERGILGILYGVFIASALGHGLFSYGLKRIHASETGIFSYIDPLATILVAIPLLNEEISLPYIVGSLLVFLGIFIAEKRLHYHPFHKLK